MRTKIMVLLGMSLLLAAVSMYGDQVSIKATIEFPFMVHGKTLPAGQYEFKKLEDGMAFRVQGEGKSVATAGIITRLSGEMRAEGQSAYVVFDVVGNASTLSEIWLPGEDGYMVSATKAKHTHTAVRMK
jgi:hypothetical protein